MSFIIRIIAPADGSFKVHRSFYVQSFGEAHNLHITTLRHEALHFPTQEEALNFWHGKDVKKAYRIEVLEDK